MIPEFTVSLMSPMLRVIADAAIISDSLAGINVAPANVWGHENRSFSSNPGMIFTAKATPTNQIRRVSPAADAKTACKLNWTPTKVKNNGMKNP